MADVSKDAVQRYDAVIVGAGFAGMYMLHKLRELGFQARVYEVGDGVGGTWYWNRYPGARCDVESLEYQYSFSDDLQREWNWTERYATQPEILRYCNHVADRFDLRRDIQFETRVTAAHYDEAADRWSIETDRGDHVSAQYCIMATGCLSAARVPDYPGRDSFRGSSYHTGAWPHEGVDFSGLRVGVIGTGSSGIQSIPQIAEQADQLFVFQRTPNFSIPARQDRLPDEFVREYKDNFQELRERARSAGFALLLDESEQSAVDATPEERTRAYSRAWDAGGFQILTAFNDLITDKEANDTAVAFIHGKIREAVEDPAVADLLSPKTYPVGTKRLCVDTGYYETYNRDNVTLVDISADPIERITPDGLRTTAGREYELDSIVYATGFDAMTGALTRIDIRGRGGLALADKWAEGPRTYLGLAVAGFPNLFTITGPGSPSVLSNMLVAIEQHVDWIADCLAAMRDRGRRAIEASVEAEDAWVAHVAEAGEATLYPLANSWYVGANVPGKPRVFMPYIGGFPVYTEKCDDVAAKDYDGFLLTEAAAPARKA